MQTKDFSLGVLATLVLILTVAQTQKPTDSEESKSAFLNVPVGTTVDASVQYKVTQESFSPGKHRIMKTNVGIPFLAGHTGSAKVRLYLEGDTWWLENEKGSNAFVYRVVWR